MAMSILGFSTEPSAGGDFLPIVKYDARAGLWFRIDRADSGQGFMPEPVDVTRNFRAIFDLENLETGWIAFPSGSAPLSALIGMKALLAKEAAFPASPGETYKHGVRFMLKLAKDIGGDKPVREVMGTSKAFLNGIEALFKDYLKDAPANAGKLPVVVMDGIAMIKTGSGNRVSSNYRPNLRIASWVPRGDLEWKPRANITTAAATAAPASAGNGAAPAGPPATGSTRAQAPAPAAQNSDLSDFG
jgi:hypothetical protein